MEHAQVTPLDPAERVAPPISGAGSGGSCASREHAQVTPLDPAERVAPPISGAGSGGSCASEFAICDMVQGGVAGGRRNGREAV
jgi:hypothetical protein